MAPVAELVVSSSDGPNYNVACIALDLTGRKLIDEIVCIGGYYHADHGFSQHVMPHRDVSQSSSRTFGIKIFTNFGRFRVLKDIKTMKTLKTKSEYSTLTDFLDWLREAKGTSDGLLLAFHDNKNQTVTPFLMEALERYKMTDDFFKVVKGFLCCQDVAEDHPEAKTKTVTLRGLAKKLLQLEDTKKTEALFYSAKDRARIVYQILQKLQETDKQLDSSALMKYASSRQQEMENLEKQRILAQKVRSLRPIFAPKIRHSLKERNRAIFLRRYLIAAGTDMEDLKNAFETSQKEGVVNIIAKTQAKKKEKDMEELIDTIIAFFTDGVTSNSRDVNGNVKKLGQGDGQPNGASTSSTDTDEEEFEEAKDGIEVEVTV